MEIFWHPHEILRKKSKDLTLEQINSKAFKHIVSRMFLLMYRSNGVGLSAPQIGLNANFFVINPYGRSRHNSEGKVIINPSIIYDHSSFSVEQEGCLSIPGIYADVIRPTKITIKSLNENGEELEQDYNDFSSRIIQHEFDHLNGRLFIDLLSNDVRKEISESLLAHEARVDKIRKARQKEKAKKANKKGKN